MALGACCVGSWLLAGGAVGVAAGAFAVVVGVAAGFVLEFRLPANGSFAFHLLEFSSPFPRSFSFRVCWKFTGYRNVWNLQFCF